MLFFCLLEICFIYRFQFRERKFIIKYFIFFVKICWLFIYGLIKYGSNRWYSGVAQRWSRRLLTARSKVRTLSPEPSKNHAKQHDFFCLFITIVNIAEAKRMNNKSYQAPTAQGLSQISFVSILKAELFFYLYCLQHILTKLDKFYEKESWFLNLNDISLLNKHRFVRNKFIKILI